MPLVVGHERVRARTAQEQHRLFHQPLMSNQSSSPMMKTCSSPLLDDVSSEAKPCPKQTERLPPSCAQKPPGTLCRLTVARSLDAIVVVARQRHDHRVHKQSADGENTFQSFLHGAVLITAHGRSQYGERDSRFPPQFQREHEHGIPPSFQEFSNASENNQRRARPRSIFDAR